MKMKNDFEKKKTKNVMTERMFHHSLVSFYIALQYCLSVCVLVCVLFIPTVGPMGTGRSPLGLLLLPFHSRFWALMLKPKKSRRRRRRRKTQRKQMETENLPTVQFFVFCIDVRSNTLCLVFWWWWWFYQNSIYNLRDQRVLVYREHCVCS